jgi:tRNA threonylcarbamoyl adenosine modification protein YeaZ
MILALNTAQTPRELALLENTTDGLRLLTEERWTDQRDDVEKLAPILTAALKEIGRSKSELKQILVIGGPGSFTGLRVGVTFANVLATALNCELFTLDTLELLRQKAATVNPLIVLHQAGGLDTALQVHEDGKSSPIQVGPLSTLLAPLAHKHYEVIASLTETQSAELHSIALEKNWKILPSEQWTSLGEALLTHGLDAWQKVSQVEAVYMKKPVITPSTRQLF